MSWGGEVDCKQAVNNKTVSDNDYALWGGKGTRWNDGHSLVGVIFSIGPWRPILCPVPCARRLTTAGCSSRRVLRLHIGSGQWRTLTGDWRLGGKGKYTTGPTPDSSGTTAWAVIEFLYLWPQLLPSTDNIVSSSCPSKLGIGNVPHLACPQCFTLPSWFP